MFGKKPPQTPPEPPQGPSGKPAANALPWAGWPDEIGCNFALGHLVRNLPVALTVDGRLHAETLMCAAGAIAGMGAHASLMADPDLRKVQATPNAFVMVGLNDGRQLLYGDAINAMLSSSDRTVAACRVWNLLAGTAISHGLNPADVPSFEPMFAHVARNLGGPDEGMPSTVNGPGASVARLLEVVGPMARTCLTGEISEITRNNGFAAAKTSWVAVTARAAASVLGQCAEVMDVKAALTMGFESAIYASKLQQPD